MQLYRWHNLYISNSNLKSVVKKLEHNSGLTIASFETNCVKLNWDKCHLLISGNKAYTCRQNGIKIYSEKVTM